MKTKMSILFYQVKNRLNKRGEAPIYCRLTIAGIRTEFSTHLFCKPEQWDQEQFKNHPYDSLYNLSLLNIRNDLFAIQLDLEIKKQPISTEIIRNIYFKVYEKTFMQCVDEYIETRVKNNTVLNPKTIQKDIYSRNHLELFLNLKKRSKIMLVEVNSKLAIDFIDYLTNTKKFGKDHIAKCIGLCKGALNYAILKDYIGYNPWLTISCKRDRPKPPISLTKDELRQFLQKKFASPRLQLVADLYIFQCYTGFAFVDVFSFDRKLHLQNMHNMDWIVKERDKSGVQSMLPLFDQARIILEKYDYKLPAISNQKYNAYLKEIAEILGINKHLTTHTARKTFAMLKLNEGFSYEAVAKFLGHASIKITQSTYAKVEVGRLVVELRKNGYIDNEAA